MLCEETCHAATLRIYRNTRAPVTTVYLGIVNSTVNTVPNAYFTRNLNGARLMPAKKRRRKRPSSGLCTFSRCNASFPDCMRGESECRWNAGGRAFVPVRFDASREAAQQSEQYIAGRLSDGTAAGAGAGAGTGASFSGERL